MIRIFYNTGRPTAHAIRDRIREAGYTARTSRRTTPGAEVVLDPDDTNITWGASLKVANPEVPLYNRRLPRRSKTTVLQAIRCCPETSGLEVDFRDVSGGGSIPDSWDEWLWRKPYGSKGADIIHATRDGFPVTTTDEHTLITQYIPKIAEFRAHVFDGEVLQVTRKKPEDPSVVAWNCGNDVVQHRIKNRIQIQSIGNVAAAAIKAQGGAPEERLFGAVDIIMDKYGRLYVLEINSAPALTVDSRLNAYCEKILALAGIEHKYEEVVNE